MQFTRLRLQGFKSFVEPTDLEIPSGLTGIVGPNGCGKSNLVEALRWVMGENSPKRMRGAEMDDVIFAGTAMRPSRNVAEVMLELDNSARSASAEFNNEDTIQVTRQIERGSGSDYRINGKPVRQRDVQILFADQATGAHSTNLVGQGQIDALIRAKPQDRRQILEEASGTAGLQARRHEAELKLKAAEQNLTRVDDVLKAYDTQLRSLKQQVRQASRYRNLAEHIRRTEAALLHLRWQEAQQNAEAVKLALEAATLRAYELLAIVTRGHTERTEAAAGLPALRQTEAAAAAIVQKLTLAREQIDAEAKRINEETAAGEQRLTDARSDRERERLRRADGEEAIKRLGLEQQQLLDASRDFAAQLPGLEQNLSDATSDVEGFDTALGQLMQTAATIEARRDAIRQEVEALTSRQNTLHLRRAQLDTQRAQLAAEAAARPDLTFAHAFVEASEKELVRRRDQAESAEQACRSAELLQTQARDTAQTAQAELMRLKAEDEAIAQMLQHQDAQAEQVIDLIHVTPGFENALAVALGEALTASLDTHAAMHWRPLGPLLALPGLPVGVTPIAQYIKAPPALARSLSQIGLVENANDGAVAAIHLKPGQIIVSRDGWAWRWDGFTVTPQAKTAPALRLQQRNRRDALKTEIATAELEAAKVTKMLEDSSALLSHAQADDKHAREALEAAFAALNDARTAYAQQEKELTTAKTKLMALDDSLHQVNEDLEQIRRRAHTIADERAGFPDPETQQMEIARTRAVLAEKRGFQAQRQGERDHCAREQAHCASRSITVAEEITAWQKRLETATQQAAMLDERIAGFESELNQLRSKPTELAAARAQLLTELTDAETRRKDATDRLIDAEQHLEGIEQKLKQDEAALTDARESRVRAEGAVQAASEHFTALRERITEKLGCAPEELFAIAAYGEEAMPAASELDQALTRYIRERENMGPVNLRAETEAETLQGEIDKLQKEKDDLTAAIAKLRQGISQLNREARERLQNAFTLVNGRFEILFKSLFGGGRAYLQFIDNDDPMEAGLEIFASPPGKKMQILSLLSGGERTLTALALLFAVFQTNPSPICVLDEAEAALDESNIGRFCTLVENISKETGTRFLIITHQRLTMARMDRLYGVTMGEKGVSQMVSVDLAGAVAIRDGMKPGALEEAASKVEDALEGVRAA